MNNPAWKHDSDTDTLFCEQAQLRVRAVPPGQAPRPTGIVELAPFALQEWTRYRLVAEPDLADRVAVMLNRRPISKDPDGPFWSFEFKNQIGKSAIQATLDGEPLPHLVVEVLSNKYPEPAEHLAFYRSLLDDLVERNVRLPFTFEAPSGHAVEEVPQPPSPLFVFHFLRQHQAALCEALATILHAPHRLLHEEEAIVPMSQADTVDAEVIDWVLANSDQWVRAPHVAVARPLRGYAPARVWQRKAEETFDTAPNRFVRHFVRGLAQWLVHRDLEPFAEQLSGVRAVIEDAQRAPLFDAVGPMRRFPTESQVLLKRDGYRELLQLWRLLQLARRPFFGPLQEVIDSRDIATLYEFWCFFALVDRLQDQLGPASLRLHVTDLHGLKHGAKARFGHSLWHLAYNHPFGRRTNRTGSYSVGLRPDYVLMRGRRAELVFDAKFRFDAQELQAAEDAHGEDTPGDDIRRDVKRADFYKMHTYRDALGARAAIALFPGDDAVFYHASTHQKKAVCLDELVGHEGHEGVGALPFRPERRSVPVA